MYVYTHTSELCIGLITLPSEGPANFLLPCFLKIEKSFNIKKYTLED